MKRILLVFVLVVLVSASAFAADFHIGIATETVSQAEDDLRGAELMLQKYGDVADGGMIKHITYPDNFMQEMETTIMQIASMADDPLMKAIIVNQAVPGTAEAFRRVRETRPDILLIAGGPHEDPEMLVSTADLSVNPDNVARGYLVVKVAHDLGADTFVHISFPRHMSYELLSRRRDIMRAACEDLGMQFVDMGSPDPLSDVGVPGAQQYILEKVPTWLEQYGQNTAFFCTNDSHTEPLLKRVAEFGGFFIEADLPSPIMGYPGAFGVEITDNEKGDWPAILAKIEQKVDEKGGTGRMGTWAYSFGYTTSAALVEHAKRVIEGESELLDMKALMDAYQEFTPGAGWNGSLFVDAFGVDADNFVLVYQDTYIFGKGYMGMTGVEVPAKYFEIGF